MPRLYELLSPNQQLQLAIRSKPPHLLAETFAAYVGQFYDRCEFDRLARQVSDLYDANSAERAHHFRARLDQRLHDRYRDPVVWNVTTTRSSEAA